MKNPRKPPTMGKQSSPSKKPPSVPIRHSQNDTEPRKALASCDVCSNAGFAGFDSDVDLVFVLRGV